MLKLLVVCFVWSIIRTVFFSKPPGLLRFEVMNRFDDGVAAEDDEDDDDADR